MVHTVSIWSASLSGCPKRCSECMVSAWPAHDQNMAIGQHLASTWPAHGHSVVSTWSANGQHGQHLASAWPAHGQHMASALSAHAQHMVSTCPARAFRSFGLAVCLLDNVLVRGVQQVAAYGSQQPRHRSNVHAWIHQCVNTLGWICQSISVLTMC